MKVRYIGPHDEVEIQWAGATYGPVANGADIDVPDDAGAGLVTQDTWEQVPDKKAAKASTPKDES
jgi:hypothetical protein